MIRRQKERRGKLLIKCLISYNYYNYSRYLYDKLPIPPKFIINVVPLAFQIRCKICRSPLDRPRTTRRTGIDHKIDIIISDLTQLWQPRKEILHRPMEEDPHDCFRAVIAEG